MIYEKLFEYDNAVRTDYPTVCGVDEAGRGPLAGPVCCAAVILKPDSLIDGLNDSKKITEKRREALYDFVIDSALAYNVVLIDEKTIDEINILNATMLGMQKAVEGLSIKPDIALIDGNRAPKLDCPVSTVIKGDATSASIAAASILAKVTRDRYMRRLSEQYPQYMLDKHKGYGTKLHYEKIKEYGIQPFHRLSFLKNINEK